MKRARLLDSAGSAHSRWLLVPPLPVGGREVDVLTLSVDWCGGFSAHDGAEDGPPMALRPTLDLPEIRTVLTHHQAIEALGYEVEA